MPVLAPVGGAAVGVERRHEPEVDRLRRPHLPQPPHDRDPGALVAVDAPDDEHPGRALRRARLGGHDRPAGGGVADLLGHVQHRPVRAADQHGNRCEDGREVRHRPIVLRGPEPVALGPTIENGAARTLEPIMGRFHPVRIGPDAYGVVTLVFHANPRAVCVAGRAESTDSVTLHFTTLGMFHYTQNVPLGDSRPSWQRPAPAAESALDRERAHREGAHALDRRRHRVEPCAVRHGREAGHVLDDRDARAAGARCAPAAPCRSSRRCSGRRCRPAPPPRPAARRPPPGSGTGGRPTGRYPSPSAGPTRSARAPPGRARRGLRTPRARSARRRRAPAARRSPAARPAATAAGGRGRRRRGSGETACRRGQPPPGDSLLTNREPGFARRLLRHRLLRGCPQNRSGRRSCLRGTPASLSAAGAPSPRAPAPASRRRPSPSPAPTSPAPAGGTCSASP